MQRHVFMTGAGGFLGNALLQEMLQDEYSHFYILSRSLESEQDIKSRLPWTNLKRLTFVRGDVTLPALGLTSQQMRWLEQRITEVWHVAACTQFVKSKDEELELTNVQGTHNMLDLASRFRCLERFYAISTAYICGTNSCVVTEDDLPTGIAFKNSYERTKYYSEQLIRQSQLPFVIIRPSIIMGHSVTGEALGETRMFYGGLLAMYHSAVALCGNEQQFWDSWHHTFSGYFLDVNARVYGHAHTTKNLVTIDDVVNVASAIRESASAVSKTFNVVSRNNLSADCLIQAMAQALKITGFRLVPSLSAKEVRTSRNRVELFLHRHSKDWHPYLLCSEPEWETRNVEALGVKRVDMTPALFEFLVKAYIERNLSRPPSFRARITNECSYAHHPMAS